MNHLKIAGAVILYNPKSDAVGNIYSYIAQIDKLYVIDNSDNINHLLVEKIKSIDKVEYIWNQTNLGIAKALNIGALKAIEDGFDYILTMDQDSKASEGMVNILLQIAMSAQGIGIVAAEHINPVLRLKPKEKFVREILYTMTSGNLLSLSAYKKVGGFREDFFIDHVDHEYCLRLNLNGYKVIKTNQTVVYHKVGNTKIKRFFIVNLAPSFHPPIRLYYRTRNRFYVDNIYKKKFSGYVREDRFHMFREFLEIILYEKDLLKKIKMICLGYLDYRRKILGKFRYEDGK